MRCSCYLAMAALAQRWSPMSASAVWSFTGSTEVAGLINRTLATRLTPSGQPIPLIAETGGQNALVVDSSALAEQVVGDVLASAFDSAGQRCSALRILVSPGGYRRPDLADAAWSHG